MPWEVFSLFQGQASPWPASVALPVSNTSECLFMVEFDGVLILPVPHFEDGPSVTFTCCATNARCSVKVAEGKNDRRFRVAISL